MEKKDIQLQNMYIKGTIPNQVRSFKSKVYKRMTYDTFVDDCSKLYVKPENTSYTKDGVYVSAYRNDHMKLKSIVDSIPLADIKKAKKNYLARVKPSLLRGVRSLTMMQAFNGIEGCRFIDRMEMSKGAGFPFNTAKRDYFTQIDDIYYPNETIVSLYNEYIHDMSNGKQPFFVVDGALKDAPISQEDQDKRKIRVYSICNFVLNAITRSLFLPLVKVMQDNPLVFELAVGSVHCSEQWGMFYRYFSNPDRMIAGDYSRYDKTLALWLTIMAYNILIEMARLAGYTKTQLRIMCVIRDIFCMPNYMHNGDVFQVFGSNCSGNPLTVIINSICNSLLFRIFFFMKYPTKDFNEFINFLSYGDDNLASVSALCPYFNQNSVTEVARSFGITYTDEDKSVGVMADYRNISDVSFLKRTFVFNTKYNQWFAPLAKESIYRSLLVGVKSKAITPFQQDLKCMETSLHESFWHGEEFFNEHRERLQKFLLTVDIVKPLPTEEEVWAIFSDKY
jgi:hypothetical protein